MEGKFSYEDQINSIVEYFRKSEKSCCELKIGFELEHIVVNKETFESISYYGENGIESTLNDLLILGWKGDYVEGNLLGAKRGECNITLEPGAQLEVSINAQKHIKDLENEYMMFLKDISYILEKKNQYLMAIGYHPVTKIEDVKFIPKDRYKHMSEYFKSKGKFAHNMMKGTASLQIAVDYKSEQDYIKKFRVSNLLSPFMSALFDNTPIFEGDIYHKHGVRTSIWNNCDDDRSMVISGALDKEFKYNDYAEFILNTPPIISKKYNDYFYTGEKQFKEIYSDKDYDLSHIFTMVFPDVRTKNFIEIRMMDSVPIDIALGAVALWKGLLYNEENLTKLYDNSLEFSNFTVKELKDKVIESGLGAEYKGRKFASIVEELLDLSKKGLSIEEVQYLEPLIDIVKGKRTLSEQMKESMMKNPKKALISRILNNKEGELNE